MMRDDAARLLERRALDVFDEALTWPDAERAETLLAKFGHEPGLIRRVERLFAAQSDAHLMRTSLPERGEAGAAPALPERVGVYRLAERIGEGGMGSVYRAQRMEGGFEQTVAIKLIRGGLFSAAAIARFAVEREILARLHHPHITRLYDGGMTQDGQSYIVMELVGGAPITEHAESLELGARLILLGDVCDAAGYAHQQGVVHADIKPGNILVDPTHGVKLLDFGISALVAGDGQAACGFTAAYASPQLQQGARPTPADDVFALGCLLSELTKACADGQTKEMRAVIARACAANPRDRYDSAGGLARDVQRLREGFPVHARPLTRRRDLAFFWHRHRLAASAGMLAAAGLAASVAVATTLEIRAEAARAQADRRFVEVRALSRYLLDDVTDQLQAYPGTSALRRDIATRSRAYLEGLSRVPQAAPEIGLEVARGYTVTGRILGLPDVQGMGDAAAAKQDLAKAEAALRALPSSLNRGMRAEAATALAQTLCTRAAIARSVDNDVALARRLYQQAVQASASQATQAGWLAHARALLGISELADDAGLFAEMPGLLDAAAADLVRVQDGADPTGVALLRAARLNLRGDATYYLGDVAGSLPLYRQAAAILAGRPGGAPNMRLLERAVYTSFNIASVLDELGRKEEGLAVIERGVADAELMRLFENSTRARHVADIVHSQRAQLLASLGRFDAAVAQARAVLADARATEAASSGSFEAARAVPVILRPMGEVYLAAGRPVEACAAFTEARDRWRSLAGKAGTLQTDISLEMPVLEHGLAQCQARTAALVPRDSP